MNHSRTMIGITLLCFLMLSSSWVTAQEPTPDQISRMMVSVSNEIYSPFCPGKNLHMCTSPNAAAVRRDIQDMARKGLDKPAIKKSILERYGEEFRIVEPPASDNVALGTALGLGLLGAIGLVFFVSRRKKTDTTSMEAPVGVTFDASSEDDGADGYLSELREEV